MFYISLIVILIFFFTGLYLGKISFKQSPDINLSNAHIKSKIFSYSIVLLGIIFGCLVVLLKNDNLLELMPLGFQRFSTLYAWSVFASIITLSSGFIITIAIKTRYPKQKYIPSLILLNLMFFILFFRINQPIYDIVSTNSYKNGGVLQSTNYSCTSASVATISYMYGKKVTEKEVAKLSNLSKFGATSGELRYTLNKLGFRYKTIVDTKQKLKTLTPLAIIYIDYPNLGKESHTVVYLGYKDGIYHIWDPLKGYRDIPQKQMDSIWHGNGIEVYR